MGLQHQQESTKFTPFFLLYGRNPTSPTDATLNFTPSRYVIDTNDYAYEVKHSLSIAWDLAKQNIQKAQNTQATQHNKRQHVTEIRPGDFVFRFSPAGKPMLSPKFLSPWAGPYTVLEVKMPDVEIIRSDKGTRSEWVHTDLLKVAKFCGSQNKLQYTDNVIDTITDKAKNIEIEIKIFALVHHRVPPNPSCNGADLNTQSSLCNDTDASNTGLALDTLFGHRYNLRPRQR